MTTPVVAMATSCTFTRPDVPVGRGRGVPRWPPMAHTFPQVRRLEDAGALRARLDELGVDLPIGDPATTASVLARPLDRGGESLANRFCVLPMEGWDATADGRPTDLVRRRWSRFGASGAALIWGGEAVAVDPAGRANPHQL